MFKYDNFSPSDIFKKDKNGDNIYFIFGKLGKGYRIIDSQVQSKLISLEGYKYFFAPIIKNVTAIKSGFSLIPPIVIPILIKVFLITVVLDFTFNINFTHEQIGQVLFLTSLFLYIISLVFYFSKIKKVLTNCEVISREEKDDIFFKDAAFYKQKEDTNIKVSKETLKEFKKDEKKKSHIATILWLILLILVFGTILKQVIYGESIIINLSFINIYSLGLKQELTYNSNPNQYIFASLFSLTVFAYSIQKLYVILKSIKWNIKFKAIYIFYVIAFLVISFPFWFFIVGIIIPAPK